MMEVDTGAEVSVISHKTLQNSFPQLALDESHMLLKSYMGEAIPVAGETQVNVQYGAQSVQLPLVIIAGERQSLMGRNWLQTLRLDWKSIATVSQSKSQVLETLLEKHKKLFQAGLGTFTGQKAQLQVRAGRARFHKARSVPFAIRDAIGGELDRLEAEGILEKISYSEWAAPIVAVPKKDGSYRICGDYKVA